MAGKGNRKLNLIDTGMPDTRDACVVLIKTEWNADIVDELERGCRSKLEELGVKTIITLTVPGAIEIPFAIKHYWDNVKKKLRPDAFIALGCIVRGNTPHFDYVCSTVTDGVLQLNLGLPVPVIFGVLTVNEIQQAKERTGGEHGHKGEEAAITAIKMIALVRSMKK